MHLLTLRKPTSTSPRVNKLRVERLLTDERMTRSGLAAVETARYNGAWDALNAVEDLIVPADLRAALQGHRPPEPNFAGFPRSAKRAILAWIDVAKRPQTRTKRIAETAVLAAQGQRAN